MSEPTQISKYTAEFIGTYVLVFSVGCNVLVGNAAFGALSVAATLMIMIYAFAKVSGGHFNPAVTVAVAICKVDFTWTDAFWYALSQMLGGLAAAGSYALLFGKTFQIAPVHPFTWVESVAVEAQYTAFLCFCVLNCAIARANAGNEYYGLCIGFSVVAGAYASGIISGGCLNPAIGIAADLVSWDKGFGWSLVYALGQFVGAAVASMLYRVVRPEEFGGVPQTLTAKLVAEFIGTYVLVYTVGLNILASVTPETTHAALSIASALMCSIYALGSVSGAHFNPAVTFGVWCSGRNKISFGDSLMYMGSQLLAAIVAGAAFGMTCESLGSGFDIGPGKHFTWVSLFIVEAIFTFVLAYAVLTVATTRKGLDNLFGLAIGFCVLVGGYAASKVSGGHLNPAVSWGAASANMFFRSGHFWKALVYSASQLVGGGAAAGVFSFTHGDEFSKAKSDLPA